MASSKISELVDGGGFQAGDATIVVRNGVNWKVDPTVNQAENPVKAWVSFNGTGTVAILASDNVTSITDNGTGLYTINFTTALTDANYAVAGSALNVNSLSVQVHGTYNVAPSVKTTSAVQINTSQSTTLYDCAFVSAIIVR